MNEHYLIKVNDKPVFIAISNKSLADGMLFFDTKQYETILCIQRNIMLP